MEISRLLRPVAGLATIYALWMWYRLRLMHAAIKKGRRVGPLWLGELAAGFMEWWAAMNGVTVKSESGEGLNVKSQEPFIYVWHPHGFISFVPSFLMGRAAVTGQPHGHTWFGTCIGLLFKIPVLGEIFQLTNARPVDRKTLESILSHGQSIAIQPGGVKEQAATVEDQEQAFFMGRLGFIRLAIKHGRPLMPLYLFGENQLYKRVHGMEWLSTIVNKLTGMTLPIVTAKWGMPQAGFFPRATDIHIRWGNPVDVGPAEADPSDERVEQVYEKYVTELKRLFDANAKDCLPPEVAANGLKVVRLEDRGGKGRRASGAPGSKAD
jgi:2-acylglycerol O-acyltransferase 2